VSDDIKRMKRPAFQFYPADWRKDAALQSCSLAAQGLWVNLMCIAHECEPYGHLTINGTPMTAAQIARLVGLSAKEAQALLTELLDTGVASTTAHGVIFSRRMVRDEDIRNRRAAGGPAGADHGIKGAEHGPKGGRPKADKGGSETPLPVDGKPPPSSSSSSSSSTTEAIASVAAKPPRASRKCPKDFEPEDPDGFVARERLSVDWRAETLKFRDHTFRGGITDWQGAWRNWMRKAVEFGTGKPATESFAQRAARARVESAVPGVAARPTAPVMEIFDVTARRLG
jgi:hypothetical protein